MAVIYVARSVGLSKWASDVGLGKHVYKVGLTDEPAKAFVQAAGWAGLSDWTLVRAEEAGEVGEDDALARLARKETAVDPRFYPKLKDTPGVFKVSPVHVENSITVARALAGQEDRGDAPLKPADFAAYLISNALR